MADKMELYHIHKHNNYDKLWKPYREITVSENFKSIMSKRYNDFTTSMIIEEDQNKILLNFHDYLLTLLSSKTQINRQEFQKILQIAYQTSYFSNMFKRETALENYRKNNFNFLPSRLHSIYLTDEKGVPYWIDALDAKDYDLCRVEVTGNIFKTNEQLLPDETLSYKDAYENSFNYWHPNFKKVPDNTNEYLVNGKIKILEKIK